MRRRSMCGHPYHIYVSYVFPGASPPGCWGVRPIEDILGAAVPETPDHHTIIARISCYFKGVVPICRCLTASSSAAQHLYIVHEIALRLRPLQRVVRRKLGTTREHRGAGP